MAFTPGIHWTTPTMMVSGLLAGCLLCLGHHLFYAALTGSAAPTGEYDIAGTNISKQKFNTAVGTAFAFLIKATLALVVSIAYMQAFWRSAKRSEKGQRLSTLDTTFSVLGNVLNLTKLHVWVKFPLLLLMAVIAWSIPIASIITPATLSVQSVVYRPSAMVKVPKLDFTSYNFAAPLTLLDSASVHYTDYCYRGPGRLVQRIVDAVGAQGQILPITPPSTNSSWTLEFWGPSLQCSNVEGQEYEDIWSNMWEFYAKDGDDCRLSYGYLAWAPTANTSVPFIFHNDTSTFRYDSLTIDAPARMLIAILPGMFSNRVNMPTHTVPGGCMMWSESRKFNNYSQALAEDPHTISQYFGGSTLLQCQVLNTSYIADFGYENGIQTVNVTNVTYSDPPYLRPAGCVTGPIALSNGGNNMTEAWDNRANASCSTLNLANRQCQFEPSLLRTLAYQSIADAFGQLIQGTIGFSGAVSTVTYNSSISKTALLDTEELLFIQNWLMDTIFMDLATLSQTSNGTDYVGLSNTNNVTSRGSIARTLEQMFQNITLSLLSERYLQPNYSSLHAPTPDANVTFTSFQNVYIYDSRTLWIAYGLAIAFTSIALFIGTTAMILNSASYNNNFSTVLRVSRSSRMSTEVQDRESDGRTEKCL
ncbi:hypothetical protein D6C78_07919 [Aureobasidium pullulans]|uniref:Uncharacterized protein n=1 Tax=Aureobasidium pullulans TaxID=5580 RepID=A0A4T0BFC7_AURPU|nr:hypothetical protein D6C78_07919 [Aureobasidium pullulans]